MERVYTTPLLDKLGVRPGARIAIVGPIETAAAEFRDLLGERTADVRDGQPTPQTDLIFLVADSTAELRPLRALAEALRPNGAIWVIWRKGKTATLRDVEVIEAAIDAGLVDNKVASFSPTHTAQRLVIPLARRPTV